MNVTLELSPFHAMQLLRWKTFIIDAAKDHASGLEEYDVDGITEAITEVDKQVRKKIGIDALEDAEAERELRRQLKIKGKS